MHVLRRLACFQDETSCFWRSSTLVRRFPSLSDTSTISDTEAKTFLLRMPME